MTLYNASFAVRLWKKTNPIKRLGQFSASYLKKQTRQSNADTIIVAYAIAIQCVMNTPAAARLPDHKCLKRRANAMK